MSYENIQQRDNEQEREKYRRVNNIEENNPWLQDSTTMSDIDRQSSKLAEHYIDNHLLGRGRDQIHTQKDSTLTQDIF